MTSNLFESPEVSGLMKDPQALKGLLQSAEAQRIIAMLQRQGDITSAAKQAQSGNTGQLLSMLSQLQNSPEGSKALQDLEGKLGK